MSRLHTNYTNRGGVEGDRSARFEIVRSLTSLKDPPKQRAIIDCVIGFQSVSQETVPKIAYFVPSLTDFSTLKSRLVFS